MEKVTTVPLYRRFGVRVLLFNVILLVSIVVPTTIIRKMDYKHLVDRTSFHRELFFSTIDRLYETDHRDWPAAVERFPRLFYQQRVCIFSENNELVYDSGVMREFDREFTFRLVLPDPYIDWTVENGTYDPEVLIGYIKRLNLDERVGDSAPFAITASIPYDGGMDRIVLFATRVRSADGEPFIVTMSQSVVDILIHSRSIKERFLFLYLVVGVLALLLTVVLSWSVTGPLKRLYRYSERLFASTRNGVDHRDVPMGGEIRGICLALERLIGEQQRQSESFMRFSSDIVHELKTPLATIRSGLELYAESDDDGEREQIYHRINRRIQQMEHLMEEIRFIGAIETGRADERCGEIASVCDEVGYEFIDADLVVEIDPAAERCLLPISCEKVYQILVNLVKNAVSFSPERGSVSLSLRVEGRGLHVRVRDGGPGIPDEVFPYIADRFFSFRTPHATPIDATRERSKSHAHSGLGLSIVDAILRGCDGRLQYRNRPEGGAEFTCSIPIYDR